MGETQKSIAIVGAGIGGLVAAYRLKQAGFAVTVFERSARAGGLVQTTTVDGFVREHAASSFLGGPPRGALALCNELGVDVESSSPNAKQRWIYINCKVHLLPTNPIEFARTKLLTRRGKLEFLREPLVPARDCDKDGDQSVHDFAARRFGAEAARAIVAPFVTGVYAADARDVSLQAGFPRFAELDRRGGVVEGGLRALGSKIFERLGLGSTEEAPAAGTRRGLFAPRGGLQSLVDALRVQLGTAVVTTSEVHAIEPVQRGCELTLRSGKHTFDGVVLACDAKAAARTLVGASELAAKLQNFERSSSAVCYLGFDQQQLPAVCKRGFGMLVAVGEAPRVLGVVFESVVWEGRAPVGKALLRCIFAGARDPRAYQLTDAELIEQAKRDLATTLGIASEPCHASVVRWPIAIPVMKVGKVEQVTATTAIARRARIALAGADFRGVSLNDLCADGDVVVREVSQWWQS